MSRIIPLLTASLLCALPTLAGAYTIAPGDTLRVDVLEDDSLSRTVLVLPDGSVNFPGVGAIRVGGGTPANAQNVIASRLASQFAAQPSVYVSVQSLAPPSAAKTVKLKNVFIMGEINKPGIVESERGLTLLQAIAQAGGFTRFAATKRVELHRVDPSTKTAQVFVFNYKKGQGISGATPLIEGDVIVVPERGLFE